MALVSIGQTNFEYDPDFSGKIKITTAEGSVVAVAAEDVLRFVYFAYVIPQRTTKAERKPWRDGLIGE